MDSNIGSDKPACEGCTRVWFRLEAMEAHYQDLWDTALVVQSRRLNALEDADFGRRTLEARVNGLCGDIGDLLVRLAALDGLPTATRFVEMPPTDLRWQSKCRVWLAAKLYEVARWVQPAVRAGPETTSSQTRAWRR